MKRARALRYAEEVARRVHSVNGILATPNAGRPAVRISRVWVFGSTVKGSLEPNDLDLLIEAVAVGDPIPWCRGRKLDHYRQRSRGWRTLPDPMHQAFVWLTNGMRGVSRHLASSECVEIDVRRLIYPRWDMPLS
jgi:hypothetical protein